MIIHYVITTNIELSLLKHAYEMVFYFYNYVTNCLKILSSWTTYGSNLAPKLYFW